MLFRGALIGLLVFVSGCVSLRDDRLINTRASLETFAAPVKCGPIGFRRVPLKARFGEYVRVTVTSPVALAGRAFIHADGEAGESHEWSTASGDPLVIEARFENDNPDRLTALNVDQPIDVTITGLEAVAGGTCEGAVFTLEHGSLVPPTSEAAWVAELERRGGPELAERRAQEAALAEERRLAHEAAWGKDDEGGLSPEEMMARLMEAEAAKEVAVSRADEWSGWNGTACPRGDACIVSGSVGAASDVGLSLEVGSGVAAVAPSVTGAPCGAAPCAADDATFSVDGSLPEVGGGVAAAAPVPSESTFGVVGSTAQSAMDVGGGVAAARPVPNDSPCVGGSCALNDAAFGVAAAAPGVADSSCGGARCASGATFEVGGGVAAAPPVFTGSPCAGSACAADDEVVAFGGSLAASEQSATQFPTDVGGGVAAAAPAVTGASCGGASCAVDGSAAVRAPCTSGGCDDALNARVDVAADALVAEAEAWGSYGDAVAAGGCATGTCAGGVVGVGSGTGGVAPCPPEGSVQVDGAATTTWSEYPSAYGGGGNGAAGGTVGSADEWAPALAVVETQVATAQHPAPVPVPMTSAPCGACVDTGVHMEVDVGLIPAMFGLLDAALSLAPPPVVFPAPHPPRHRARPVR